MVDYHRILVVFLMYFIANSNNEVFAVDIIFSQELLCPANILRLQCHLSDTKTVDTIYHIIIYKLDEQVVILKLNGGSENDTINWNDETIENISSTEESSIFPANEARLVVQIRLASFFEMREDSVMFRCTINGKVLKLVANEWEQGLTVRKEDTGCPSAASAGQKIRAEYANILAYIIACTMLITIFSD